MELTPIFILKLTGLYLGNESECCKIRHRFRACILISATIAYACRSLYRIITVYSKFSWRDVSYIVWWGWQVQAIISMFFIIYWQHCGYIRHLTDHVILKGQTKLHAQSSSLASLRLRKRKWMWFGICTVMTVSVSIKKMMDAVRKAAELGIPLTEKTMNLHRFDIVYRLIGVYENIALNYCLCFFVIVVSSLIVELDEFNAGFDQLLTSTKMIPSLEADKFEETLSNRLLDSYLTHKRLGGKIAEVDRIFQYYILALVSTGLPITVLAFIINIRQRSSLSMVFTIDDVFCCFVHLVGFTVLPARVNSKFKAVQKQLYWCSIIWKQYDERIYHISQVFSEHASQQNIGLSLAGLVVITKSVIITSVSVLVPYVILCLQLNIGVSEKELYFYRGNITRFD